MSSEMCLTISGNRSNNLLLDEGEVRANLCKHLHVGEPILYPQCSLAEVTEFISLLGAVETWEPLKVAATVYLSALGKDLASATTKGVARLLKEDVCAPLADTTKTIASAANWETGGPVEFRFGLNFPDKIYGTAVSVKSGASELEIGTRLAVFVAHAGQIDKVIREVVDEHGSDTQVFLTIREDGSIMAQWYPYPCAKENKTIIPNRCATP